MKIAIADPPYLGRAVRWYGEGGCGDGYGKNQADNHPEAHIWDNPETHKQLVRDLQANYDAWAIAMSVHSLSTYLDVVDTDSRNGIRVGVWQKTNPPPSGSRILNAWEPVLFYIPAERRGYGTGVTLNDVLTAPRPSRNFVGSKPAAWTEWVLDILGWQIEDEVTDIFTGSGAVSEAVENMGSRLI